MRRRLFANKGFLPLVGFFIFLGFLCQSSFVSAQNYGVSSSFDYAPDVPDSIMQQRIATLDVEVPITFNAKVRRFIDYFTIDNRSYTKRILSRRGAYFELFEAALKRHNMPDNLKYLVIVESGINPKAKSPVGALGFWQFMPATGKMYGLNYDYYIDDRMDPVKSTEAACKFLKQLYAMFRDWELALAAYNCGPGNVRKAIRRSGYKKTFWEVYRYLPRETRGYVPQFMAFNYVVPFAEEHNLFVDEPLFLPKCDTLVTDQYVNLNELARVTNSCVSELLLVNPEVKRNVIPDTKKGYLLKVPTHISKVYRDSISSFKPLIAKKGNESLNYNGKEPSWSKQGKVRIVYVVKSGDVLGKIAERYGVSVSNLRVWNNIGRNNVIRVGQRLYIYKSAKNVSNRSYSSSTPVSVPSNGVHVVKSGESLWSISKKYNGMTVDKLKKLNGLSSSSLHVGQVLKLK